MNYIILTQDQGKILGPIAKILGVIINWIFNVLDSIGIPSVGLAIIFFTIFIYICLFYLTFKQQKFSKMSAVMNPEIQAVQQKYKGKKDNESVTRQNQEIQEIYAKYGVSPTGSCLQMVIQLPILFALYRVIYNMPAYVDKVRDALTPLADKIIASDGGSEYIQTLDAAKAFAKADFTLTNTIIDVLNRASTKEWGLIKENISGLGDVFDKAQLLFLKYYDFLGINIADSPSNLLKAGFEGGKITLMIGALLVPALAAITQWLNVLFMPQAAAKPGEDNPMASSMKTMNVMMPLMSAVFCFTLPAGMGIYWIASAVVRCVQQVGINKYFDKKGIDAIIEQNIKNAEKKAAKKKTASKDSGKEPVNPSKIASISTKNISVKDIPSPSTGSSIKPGSLAEKANLVKKYNEENR